MGKGKWEESLYLWNYIMESINSNNNKNRCIPFYYRKTTALIYDKHCFPTLLKYVWNTLVPRKYLILDETPSFCLDIKTL